ncbi:MAG: hypothetical protein R3C26_22595 [Calditrichia bacterium]
MSSYVRALRSFLKLMVWMWRQQFDVVFDFEIGSRFTALLTAANLRSTTIRYAPAGDGKNVFDVTIPYIESTHMTRIYLRSLDALNMKIYDERLLKLPIKIEEKQNVSDFVKSQQLRAILWCSIQTPLISDRTIVCRNTLPNLANGCSLRSRICRL